MDLLSLPGLRADHRLAYGKDAAQFGDLWVPRGIPRGISQGIPEGKGRTTYPLVVFFHGGWWKSEYDLGYAGYLCDALKREGMATWSVEYRRVGATGGGWPMTFQDASAGFDFVTTLAAQYPLDLSRVVAMGHSAGALLAFWMAGRHHLPVESGIAQNDSYLPLRGVVSLAGAVDLRLTIDLSGQHTFAHDREEVFRLMGGQPQDLGPRYGWANPGDLLPLRVPQLLLQGTEDDQIPPELPHRWASKAASTGSSATVKMIPGADHFDVVDPQSGAWKTVLAELKAMLGVRS